MSKVFIAYILAQFGDLYDKEEVNNWRVKSIRGMELNFRTIVGIPYQLWHALQKSGVTVSGPLKGKTSHLCFVKGIKLLRYDLTDIARIAFMFNGGKSPASILSHI